MAEMSGEDHHLELGSNAFVQGFEEQLVGADKGETKEIKVTFPEEYVNDRLAGCEAVFTCTVKDILQAVVPAVDEALATLGRRGEPGCPEGQDPHPYRAGVRSPGARADEASDARPIGRSP